MVVIATEGLNATAGVMTGAAGLLTVGRFIIHWHKNHKLRWDDWFNAVALVFLVAGMVMYGSYSKIPADRAPTRAELVHDMKINIADIVLFFCTIYSVKASFLALYWQIFQLSKRFQIAWFSLTAYIITGFVVSVVTVFTRCGQGQYFDSLEKCSKRSQALFVGYQALWCILNVTGDILLIILPISMLKSLHMRTGQKVGLSIVFALVLIIVTMDVLRTVYTLEMDLQNDQDANILWCILEPTIAVMVCALPCYRGLLRFNTGTTESGSLWSSGQSSAWSRLFKTSHSASGSMSSVDKEGMVARDSSQELGYTRSHV